MKEMTKMNDTQKAKRIARIFEEVTGRYHICGDDLGYLDARGPGYATKAAAMEAAKNAGYTYARGSGTYRKGITRL